MTDESKSAAINLQAIIDEERRKRQELEDANKALIEEFTSCNDFDDIRKLFKEKLKEVAPTAILNIVRLANYADSESVQANLNKWILEWVMSDKIDGSTSEIATLLKDLQKQTPAKTT